MDSFIVIRLIPNNPIMAGNGSGEFLNLLKKLGKLKRARKGVRYRLRTSRLYLATKNNQKILITKVD